MMRWRMALMFLLVGLVASCAPKVHKRFVVDNLAGQLGQGYQQKVDNFLIIFDASSSMFDKYEGTKKFHQAKDTILGINQAIDGLKLQGGVHVIGYAPRGSIKNDHLIYGLTDYTASGLAKAVERVTINGVTPIGRVISASINTLKDTTGNIAVIVVSDGVQMSLDRMSPRTAAADLKKVYGDRACFYTVLIGDNPRGKQTMDDIAKAGDCGFATTQSAIANTAGMRDFVTRVFFGKTMGQDSKKPVSLNLDVKFDFDKADIRPQEKDNIDEVASFLQMHPEISITLEGHTCNMGPEAYNMNLSLRRAESVKKYMVNKFDIAPSRIAVKGYGFSRPIASNDNEEGRRQNRRVMATIKAK